MAAAAGAWAQTYPARAVRLVVPFPAGSQTDLVARLIGQQLQDALGKPFVVENKPGAAGAIAASAVATSAPDGYTLLVTTAAIQAANVSLIRKLSYDPVKDFAPVARLANTSMMLMVRPDFPATSLDGFLAHVRAQPGKLSAGYGSPGAQVALAMLKQLGRLETVDVPYKGIPQAATDLIGGTLAFTFVDVGNAVAQARGGRLRPLGVTSAERAGQAPDVPALGEVLRGFEVSSWYGLAAPAGTGAEAVAVLNAAVARILAQPDVREKFLAIGTSVAPMAAEPFGAFIRAEIDNWARMVKMADIKPE
ncbi:MAG: tripartite tricarboxylate transporter substrate binding protein [Burkholderiales bacterium]|nr:tripartite tricarboxylate transporter substrate binding protein [Burkholderiales bacterium]